MSGTCPYCQQHRPDMEGWHDCPGSRDAKARMDTEIQARIAGLERVAGLVPRRKK